MASLSKDPAARAPTCCAVLEPGAAHASRLAAPTASRKFAATRTRIWKPAGIAAIVFLILGGLVYGGHCLLRHLPWGRIGASGGVQLWEEGPYWAECNVGAMKPEESGYYFWWGDTVGYVRKGGALRGDSYEGVIWVSGAGARMDNSPFDKANCPTFDKDDEKLLSAGYVEAKRNSWKALLNVHLAVGHDAATEHLGAPWRMPTGEELRALQKNCDGKWTTHNGVPGMLMTGRGVFSTKNIFLPAAGLGDGNSLDWVDGRPRGCYWSASTSSSCGVSCLTFYDGICFAVGNDTRRCFGKPVRPLRDSAR